MHASQPAEGALVFAPVSPAVAALLHQLQAQIIREASERKAAVDPMGDLQGPVRRHEFFGGDVVEYIGANGRDTLRRRRICPEGWVRAEVPWHPSHWRLDSERKDAKGRRWDAFATEIYVTDDFGMLVLVADE